MKYKDIDSGPIVSAEEFFQGSVVTTDGPPLKRSKGRAVGAFLGFIALSALAGALIVVPASVTLATVAQAAEAPLEHWKNLPETLDDVSVAERNVLLDINGNKFAEFWTEDRIKLENSEAISQYAIDALVATEDKRFWEHAGFDAIGTARAAVSGSGGGSGITQQLVKNLQFYNQAGQETEKDEATEYSLERKIQELRYAMAYETKHTKKEILTSYFNTVAFGSPNVYSIESAANYFFGKPAKDLSLAEASALVGTVQNPSRYNMDSTDEATVEAWRGRQQAVLARMVAEEYVTQEEADAAYAEELTFVRQAPTGNCSSSSYPFYCEYVVDHLLSSSRLGETPEERSAILSRGGLVIKTHLDPRTTDAADSRLEFDFGNENRAVTPVALVKPGDGGVETIAVNREYGEGPGATNINVALNPVATGSTFKMVTLAAALRSGMSESDLAFASASCPFVSPNYDTPAGGFVNSTSCGLQGGYMDYRNATALSSNTWFITLATKVGMENVYETARELGLYVPENLTNRALSYVIGSTENSPVAMAAAYATFANEGVYCPPTPVVNYEYRDGSKPAVPDTYDPASDSCKRVMSSQDASIVLKALRANTVPGDVGTAFGTMAYIPGYDAVGKTGTNELFNYAWAQVTKEHSLFIAVYDMVNFTDGVVHNMIYQGRFFTQNASSYGGSNVLRDVLAGTQNVPLNFDSQDDSAPPVPVDSREMFTVPSVAGMEAEEALATLQALGVPVHVSKETRPTPAGYPYGVIVEQSVAPGTELPLGTKKEIILYIGE